MSERLLNTLSTERARLGWSQSRLAEAAGISRQGYAAIEAGTSVPSTEVALRLAAALGRTVSELFRLPEQRAEHRVATWSGTGAPVPGSRVRLTPIAGRWIAHPSADAHRPESPADGVVDHVEGEQVAIRLLADRPPPAGLAVVGCDPAFGVLVEALQRERGVDVSWNQRGSRAALVALARGDAHIAGIHLKDAASGTWNEPFVRETVPFPCARVAFAIWEQGLLVRPDVHSRIRGIADMGTDGIRLLNREAGSGSRALLDEALATAGVDVNAIVGYHTSARGHLAVADGISAGAADAGIAIRAAGEARGLDFLPIREEAYELVVPEHFLDLPPVCALLELLRRPGTRAQVEALGGYDGAAMGSPA